MARHGQDAANFIDGSVGNNYRFNGRDMRLTDVYGTLVPQIVNECER